MEFPLGLFGIALATVTLPYLSRQAANQSMEAFADTVDWSMRLVTLIATPAAVGLIVLAEPLVAAIFYGGEFTRFDVEMAALSLQAFAAGLIGFSFVKILAPAYFAREDTKTPVRIGLIALAINFGLSVVLAWWLTEIGYVGTHAGLALAISMAAIANAWLLFRGLRSDGVVATGDGWLPLIRSRGARRQCRHGRGDPGARSAAGLVVGRSSCGRGRDGSAWSSPLVLSPISAPCCWREAGRRNSGTVPGRALVRRARYNPRHPSRVTSMILSRQPHSFPFDRVTDGSVVTIGSFDGLHLGHRALLDRVFAESADRRASISGDELRADAERVFSRRSAARATDAFPGEVCGAFAGYGVDIFFCPRFDESMKNIAADTFIRQILVHALNVRHLVIGDDFRFAQDREGNLAMLERAGSAIGFSVEQVSSVEVNGERVSSSVDPSSRFGLVTSIVQSACLDITTGCREGSLSENGWAGNLVIRLQTSISTGSRVPSWGSSPFVSAEPTGARSMQWQASARGPRLT